MEIVLSLVMIGFTAFLCYLALDAVRHSNKH